MTNSSSITPAMAPPAGMVSNFVDPPSCGLKFLVVNCVFLPLAVIALVVRMWTRIYLVRSVSYDDYLMIISVVLSCILTGVTLDMLNWGLGKHMWDVPYSSLTPWFLKLNVVAAIIYCAGTGFTKVSVLIFYLRIFPSKTFHYAVWTVIFIAVGYNVASVLANIFSCSPVAASWDYSITNATCMNRPVFYFANAGLGIFTDFMTTLVPIPWLRRLQMPFRQKFAVGAMLAMGCIVGVISCIRLSSLYTLLESTDLTWTTTNALMWCTIELNLGIIGGCTTAMRPFVRRYFPRLLGFSTHSGGYHESASRKYGHPLGSIPRDAPEFAPASNHYSTRLHGGTNDDSEEHILPGTTTPGPTLHRSKGSTEGIIRTVEFNVDSNTDLR
ncbi:integral membrane protein [Aspergillus uvarum CBS 121591]|uniref:Integral membrane protein n=1 Tax=Aspergillus uvarum CBS 121591 TaxID=1448315 RepID=A0A319CB68_9EURO|nr:integral membrane protein [Aspergillus uvarum CBS 121591]PYH82464.1 integral membrane protein [Aspergillus uvarum CBS 121591]